MLFKKGELPFRGDKTKNPLFVLPAPSPQHHHHCHCQPLVFLSGSFFSSSFFFFGLLLLSLMYYDSLYLKLLVLSLCLTLTGVTLSFFRCCTSLYS